MSDNVRRDEHIFIILRVHRPDVSLEYNSRYIVQECNAY